MAKLEHIGIAVANLDDALRVWREILGSSPYKVEAIEKDGIRTHFLNGGTAKIELLEAMRADSAISGYLEKRGAGLHHLAFEVNDLRSVLDDFRATGYTLIDLEPRPGADGKMIAFLHPGQTGGVLIELCESRESVFGSRGLLVNGRSTTIGEAGRPENPPLLILGFAGLAETVGRHLERCCYVVSVDDLESPPADILNALGVKKAHIAAAESFFEPALEAAARKAALSLSFLCGRSAVMASQRPECPVLILAFDGDEEVRKALAIRSVLGGALAVIPAGQESLVAEVIEHHITLMSGRAFFTEE